MNIILIRQEDSKHAGRTEVPEKFVTEGKPTYETWVTEEFAAKGKVRTGLCTMEAGAMTIRNYPTDEVFTLVSGKFEITNEDGSVVAMTPARAASSERVGAVPGATSKNRASATRASAGERPQTIG